MSEKGNCGCAPKVRVKLPCAAGLSGTITPQGTRAEAVVSSAATVCKGEFVRRELEYIGRGDAMKWTSEDTVILDTAELSEGRVGVVYTQGGRTKYKTVALDAGNVALGNTLVLLEDTALEEARIAEISPGRAVVVYTQEAAGMAAVVSLEGRLATLAYTDIWADGGDPANLCVCCVGGSILVSGMLQDTTSDGGHAGETWVWRCAEKRDGTGLYIYYQTPQRVDLDSDTDVYSGGWSLAAVTNQTAVLYYPKSLDRPVGFAVLDLTEGGTVEVRLVGAGKYAASLPALQVAPVDNGRWCVAYGVGWLDPQKSVLKSALAFEVWGLNRYAAELLWYGCDDVRYKAGVGGISAGGACMGVAVSYTGSREVKGEDGTTHTVEEAKAVYLGLEDGPAPGVPVPLPGHDGFCRLVPISVSKAILIYQADGNGYARYMELEERVVPSGGGEAFTGVAGLDALAITGGGPNETITVQVP